MDWTFQGVERELRSCMPRLFRSRKSKPRRARLLRLVGWNRQGSAGRRHDHDQLHVLVILMIAGKSIVAVWFAASALLEVSSNFLFYRWLVRRGVSVRFIGIGTPGYLDTRYSAWCRDSGRSSKKVLLLRRLSLVNSILAGAAFVAIVHMSGKHEPIQRDRSELPTR